jgi:O-antigen biosynthesis protein
MLDRNSLGVSHSTLTVPTYPTNCRPHVKGKYIFIGDKKLYIQGVTYGPFRPEEGGSEYHTPEIVNKDFAHMVANGINAVRTYTIPPRWLLDAAEDYGLRVMAGIPWEQHVTFLDDKQRIQSIQERVREGVHACAGHPAILCYTLGNEIPASIVRWYGHRRVERFLEQLYHVAKAEDTEGLVTYVNYPTTEYLQPTFVDFVCFNVYLESPDSFMSYLARLHNLAGNKPLVMAEIGLDSRRNGEQMQAEVLDWQIKTVFEVGCAGAFIFAWTDEWHRGGHDIDDWDFGLTSRERQPKAALSTIRNGFSGLPLKPSVDWPQVSVVVCSYNGAETIGECCAGLARLEYPNYEVIVVDDGSSDETAAIAQAYGFLVIRTQNGGLSRARNIGMEAATGEIVAYLDDDTVPDPHWLSYLALAFMNSTHAGIGGPNISPAGDGFVAECVSNSPGNPTHVLLSDQEAEHIPGCNMAFRKGALQAVKGFDPQFRTAGDDVDLCWRLQHEGWTLGFSPGAMVWHHRRNSIKGFWRQQVNYGKAEALLEMKWPEKYNILGHLSWGGKIYGNMSLPSSPLRRWRIYYGVWGSRHFQSIYEAAPGTLFSLPLMPEWYLVIATLAFLSLIGLLWSPLLLFLPLLVLAGGVSLLQAFLSGAYPYLSDLTRPQFERLRLSLLTGFLHLLQPLARLIGRLQYGLTPWRRRRPPSFALPWPRTASIWSERWQSAVDRLTVLEAILRKQGAVVQRGGDFDSWDLEIRGGLCGLVRMRMALEEHGDGKQMIRIHSWPLFSVLGALPTVSFASLGLLAAFDQALAASIILFSFSLLLAVRTFESCAAATAFHLYALNVLEKNEDWAGQVAGETSEQ